MTITQVLYALETARCQNVSKAAERMFVSQPALSAQLGKLEEELGCKLFRRGHQGVSLTAAGVSFCQTAEAAGQLLFIRIPVPKGGMIVIAFTEPAVIHDQHFYAQCFGFFCKR